MLAALAAVPLVAHHAFGGEFDPNRPILLRGAVTKVEWVNPHAWIHLAAKEVTVAGEKKALSQPEEWSAGRHAKHAAASRHHARLR
ncbi:MAG: DUF6152 family protein [Vicinamibacterales bacterium]